MRKYTNPTTLRARALRQTANPAEQALWAVLMGRRLGGFKFTRQFPIGPYFTDFACRERWLLIEVYGSQHFENDYDQRRDAFLLDQGYSLFRVPSHVVLQQRDVVCDGILAALDGRIDDEVHAPDLVFARSFEVPRRLRRRRMWLAPTPAPPSREG